MVKKHYIIPLLALMLAHFGFAQKKNSAAELYARPYGDKIALRWQIFDFKIWEEGITNGYDVYRKDLVSREVILLNDSSIKALTPEQWALRYSVINEADTTITFPEELDSLSLQAMIFQFPEETEFSFDLPDPDGPMSFGDDPAKVRWLFHSLACLYSKEAADVSGLYFEDNNVRPFRDYSYWIVKSGADQKDTLAKIDKINSSEKYLLLPPQKFEDYTNRKQSFLSWAKADTGIVDLPMYELFRSKDPDKGYQLMSKTPILAEVHGNWLDSSRIYFKDTTLEKEQTYYYKSRGKTLFGEYTPFSEPYKVTERTTMKYAPFIDEAKFVKKTFNRIIWDINQEELENVVGFQILRSQEPDTLFEVISKRLKKEARSYDDLEPIMDGYYAIRAFGKAGDTLTSDPAYVHIPDTIPPSAPEILEAICDSNGIITIKWKHGGEQDLYGFKLYTANYKSDEFSRVFGLDSVFTIYYDTISLRSLSKHVYYKLMAHDKSFNPSEFSNIVEVKRYDIIPPNPPVLHKFESGKEGISLTWANSTSIDLAYTILFRKVKGATNWETLKVFQKDTNDFVTYVDTAAKKGQTYEYLLKAVDDSELESTQSDIFTIKMYDDGFREPIKNISVSKSKRKRTVKLAWEYNEFGVEKFLIYRGKDEGRMTILASLKPEEREYYDEKLTVNHKYKYRIKAVYDDSGESPYSEEIEVTF